MLYIFILLMFLSLFYNKSVIDYFKPVIGVLRDKNLNWYSHINYVSSRLSRDIFLFRRLNVFVHTDYDKTNYYASFQSILRYGLVAWDIATKITYILFLKKIFKNNF